MSKLQMWQEREQKALTAYAKEIGRMDEREKIYAGGREIEPTTDNDYKDGGGKRTTAHVWNIVAENIEAEIDSSVPMPKVTPVRREDEALARMIENMLRNELDRMPTELLNDMAERIAKKQGGAFLLTEWDENERTHTTVGANRVSVMHPKRLIPQDGVTELADMDYYFVRSPMTKRAVKERWGVDVEDESEDAPEIRNAAQAEDMVTVEMAYYRNDRGGVGRYVWVANRELEDKENCLARTLKKCKKCGQTQVDNAWALDQPTYDGEYPEGAKPRRPRRDQCAYCGSRTWEDSTEESRQVPIADLVANGAPKETIDRLMANVQPVERLPMMDTPEGMSQQEQMLMEVSGQLVAQAAGMAEISVEIPYYEMRDYPVVLMRNQTAHEHFLGESDVDAIADQQNTMNRMQQKMLDRIVKAGSILVLPAEAQLKIDSEDQRIARLPNNIDLDRIKLYTFEANLNTEVAYIEQVYAESQKRLGITESFLGRRDATATSGTAKEFAAAQTAGRLESKRVLKKLAWSEVFERMFHNMLAFADERRPLHMRKEDGETEYEEWNAWAFLAVDEAGEVYWKDEFLFSCDDASGLAANREAMWKETTAHLQSGAYGNPAELETLVAYWTAMEGLHYPGAGETKKLLEARMEAQQQAAQQQAMMQQQMAAQPQAGAMPQQRTMLPTAETAGGMM